MNEKFDHDLDVLLKRHLESRLRGQLGRATEAFRRECAGRPRRGWVWRWASAAGSLAACVAVVWSVAAYRASRPTGTEGVKVAVVNDASVVAPVAAAVAPEEPIPVLESATWSPVVDEGLGLVDNQPVRKLRRDVVEEVEWFDPRHKAVVRTTTPKQQIFLIDVKTD